MLAVIEKIKAGFMARYERPLNHSITNVWDALTKNDKLAQWMPNLEVVCLEQNGIIKFNMNDGTGNFFDMKIRDYKENEILEFEWGNGWVCFELISKPVGCLLVLKEFFPALNDHTPKDLAGWHVCLDVLSDLLEGHTYAEFPRGKWEKWHKEYIKLVEGSLQANSEE